MAIKIKFILDNESNWNGFMNCNPLIRPVVQKEVEKAMGCGEESKGFSEYHCFNCDNSKFVPFTCKSRLCTSCGKKHADRWAIEVNKQFLNVIHRHMVFTVSDKLWHYMEEDRGSWKVMFDSVAQTLNEMFAKDVTPGILCVMHPFGRDMGFKPHVHVIVSEGGLNKRKQWVGMNFFSYEKLRNVWQYNILTNMKRYFINSFNNPKLKQMTCSDMFEIKKYEDKKKELSQLIDNIFKQFDNGFYVRAKDRVEAPKHLVRYIGRYLRHPAIAESRIIEYSPRSKEDKVVFFYEDSSTKEKKTVTMTVFQFIEALIKHVPDPNFKMVRWYGLYSRRKWRKVKTLLVLIGKYNIEKERYLKGLLSKVGKIICRNCGSEMEKIGDLFRRDWG